MPAQFDELATGKYVARLQSENLEEPSTHAFSTQVEQIRPAEWICQVAARFYGTMIDIVPKFMVAVPDWPCIVKCAAAELVLGLLPLPAPVAPPQEVSPAPSTTMSTKTASPRTTAEGRLPFRR